MQVDLQGKIALITGAARGIGRAIADQLAANGARVVATDIDHATLERSGAAGHFALALAMDVTQPEQIQQVINRVVQELGRLDILVNNAGINTLQHRVTIDQFPVAEWDRILNVDLRGLFLVSRAAAAAMVRQGGGRVINISSVLGLVPARLQSPFVAAKAGVINLTRSMALELASHGVLVNCIAPGSILTDATKALFYGADGQFNDKVKQLLAHIPLGRPGTVAEVACAALFLAAPENTYLTGQVIVVDGGWTAGYLREF